MRRIVLWLSSTAVVLALLFGYHTSFAGPLAATGPLSSFTAGVLAAPATSGSSSSPSTTPASGSTPSDTSSTTVTGDVAQTRWGPVQVEVSVSGSEITGVSVVQYPDDNPRDAEINAYALPVLVQETMSAQSSSIDMVSGATYTSVGYQQSLQSALDRAGL
ncbi:FMN-binding protein [Nocardioides currus]|uniref:FMN-binding protein n=1 Tax=Nocardioides currus TaxID=2133958 RepID=A0A2R7Z1X6_9ACTN|nr:FMN-binding protein [Nocardioides currus]PUA82256.1 FMN-binding protein [Nocardioides currus]